MTEREKTIREVHKAYAAQDAEEVRQREGFAAVEDLLRVIDELREKLERWRRAYGSGGGGP